MTLCFSVVLLDGRCLRISLTGGCGHIMPSPPLGTAMYETAVSAADMREKTYHVNSYGAARGEGQPAITISPAARGAALTSRIGVSVTARIIESIKIKATQARS